MPDHICPEDRASWAPCVIQGFYIKSTIKHYRSHKMWTPSTNSKHIIKTIKWYPYIFLMPIPSQVSLILAAADDLTRALKYHHHLSDLPFIEPSTTYTLTDLAALFHHLFRQRPVNHKTTKLSPRSISQPRVSSTKLSTPLPLIYIIDGSTIDNSIKKVYPASLPSPLKQSRVTIRMALPANISPSTTFPLIQARVLSTASPSMRISPFTPLPLKQLRILSMVTPTTITLSPKSIAHKMVKHIRIQPIHPSPIVPQVPRVLK